jgi:hypothetical protein
VTASTVNWESSWTTTTINSSAIANAANAVTAAISMDAQWAIEISVTIVYGSPANQGVRVYVERDVDGTNFESVSDNARGFEMPRATSATRRRTFTLSAQELANFRVRLTNDSGASVTATVRYRYATDITSA